MEGSDKGLRSPTPTKRSAIPKPSASDENDQYYQQVGPRKPMMAKNYMSPTISAASKAAASRKTILGERNEASEPNSSNTHVEKSQLCGNDSLSPAIPLSPSVFETHVDDEQSALSDGLVASRPYDPITNYLSPRPKFLRYKPNRRRELILGLENSISERSYDLSFSTSGSLESEKSVGEEIGAATTPSPLASPFLGGFCKQEDEDVEVSDEEIENSDEKIGECDEESDGGNEESDEEDEELVEEKGWFLKGVLKSLLVMLIVVLFASHMSPMNQQTHSEVVEYGHSGIWNSTFEAGLLKKLERGGNLWDQTEERQMSLVEVMRGGLETGFEEVNVVGSESGGEVIGQGEETQSGPVADQQRFIDEGVKDEGQDEDENLGGVEYLDETREVLEPQAEETEVIAVTEDEMDEVVVLQVEDIEEISDQMVDDSEFQNAADEPYQKPPMSHDVDPQNQVTDVSKSFEQEGRVAEEKIDEMVVEGIETMDNVDTDFEEVLDSEAEGNWTWREELINHMKSRTCFTAVVGVSIFFVIIASLLLVFRLKQRNGAKKHSSVIGNPFAKPLVIEQKKINENVSSLPSKPYSEPAIAEKYNSVLPSRGEDSIEHVYSPFRRMSLSSKYSAGAAYEECFHSQAPSVQLLGEFVVGGVSSSLRTCSMKTKITENEESNYSVSSKKGSGSKVHSVSIQSQPSISEFSSMASPSHGSFTPQKVMKQKEGDKDGGVTSTPLRRLNRLGNDGEATTPLRRSSRLRSRPVTSP